VPYSEEPKSWATTRAPPWDDYYRRAFGVTEDEIINDLALRERVLKEMVEKFTASKEMFQVALPLLQEKDISFEDAREDVSLRFSLIPEIESSHELVTDDLRRPTRITDHHGGKGVDCRIFPDYDPANWFSPGGHPPGSNFVPPATALGMPGFSPIGGGPLIPPGNTAPKDVRRTMINHGVDIVFEQGLTFQRHAKCHDQMEVLKATVDYISKIRDILGCHEEDESEDPREDNASMATQKSD